MFTGVSGHEGASTYGLYGLSTKCQLSKACVLLLMVSALGEGRSVRREEPFCALC